MHDDPRTLLHGAGVVTDGGGCVVAADGGGDGREAGSLLRVLVIVHVTSAVTFASVRVVPSTDPDPQSIEEAYLSASVPAVAVSDTVTSLPRVMVVDPCSPSPAAALTTVEPTRRSKRPGVAGRCQRVDDGHRWACGCSVIVQVTSAVTLVRVSVVPVVGPDPQSIEES